MRDIACFKAVAALHRHLRAQGVAAGFECGKRAALAGQQFAAVLLQKAGLKCFDDVSEAHYLTSPQLMLMLFIIALMRTMAASLLPVVRWV